MYKNCLLAVDMGVSFIKIGIYNTEGQCICSTKTEVPGYYPEPGMFIQSADKYFELVVKEIKNCTSKFPYETPDICAVGFSAAMGGALGIDKDFNITADWSIISDTRFNPYSLFMLKNKSREILELSGTNFPVFGAKILWWKKENESLYKKTRKFIFLCSYISSKMAGLKAEEAFVDKSHLQWTALADLKNSKWSEELCEEFEIDKNLLPEIVSSHKIVGRLDKKIADACGLKSGILLTAGAGDKPAGTVGAGLCSNGILIDESASFAALSLCIDRYVPDTENKTLENLVSPIEGFYLPSIFISGSGVTHQWFADNFCENEKKLAAQKNMDVFSILDLKASKIKPGSEKLFSIGLLGGRGYPIDPDIRGLWINHNWSHKKEHFWRSLLESFGYEFSRAINIMKKNYKDVGLDEIRVIGGASKSDLWNQIKADITGIPYVKLDRDDLTLLGDIAIAGYGAGIYDNLQEVSEKFISKKQTYYPDLKNHNYYKKFLDVYESIFNKTRSIYVDLKNIENF